MTLPTATNTDPALRARIAAILAPFPADPVGHILATVAETEARNLRAFHGQAWKPSASDRLNIVDAAHDAAEILDRALSPAESAALEACIRAHLEAVAESYRAPFDADICGRCRNGDHARCSAVVYPDVPAAVCLCPHAAAPVAIPEPPTHPSPMKMAMTANGLREGDKLDLVSTGFSDGIAAERARLRAHLLDLADVRLEAARALNEPAPRDMSAAIEAAEFVGEARALRELAAGLK